MILMNKNKYISIAIDGAAGVGNPPHPGHCAKNLIIFMLTPVCITEAFVIFLQI